MNPCNATDKKGGAAFLKQATAQLCPDGEKSPNFRVTEWGEPAVIPALAFRSDHPESV